MSRHVLITSAQLGLELQASRRAMGLTQADIGTQIGLSQSRVSHLELHPEQLSAEQLLAWCAVLGLELSIGMRHTTASAPPATDW
ncbi:helix-turn-helix domain-containing protein [Pigmentiphaga litoralis]|uniref:helix-turn-helix domain-containing protein n=1 Tax=Pigmentiphaga litoralis TaxID=516702 RepID=UPI003B43295E